MDPATSDSTTEPLISVRGLMKQFGRQVVLDGVNLDIHPGETMVIMGGSGCGKSTLLRLLIGAIQPTMGVVEMFGQQLQGLDEAELDEIRRRFGILFTVYGVPCPESTAMFWCTFCL